MQFEKKFGYMMLGGLLVLVGQMLPHFSSGNATAEGEKLAVEFDLIKCRRLEVIDDEGRMNVALASHETGGSVQVFGKTGKSSSWLGVDKHGGYVTTHGTDGISKIWLGINQDGSLVLLRGRDGISGSMLGVKGDRGYVSVLAKNGGGSELSVNEQGGRVSVFGKGNSMSHGMMSVNESGAGIELWDENGHQLNCY